jgi:hypothetical protein
MTTITAAPVVERITSNLYGIPGQIAYTAAVRYGSGPVQFVSFASSRHGGSVAMVAEGQPVEFVPDPDRFGRLSPRWVRRYFGQEA